ncbi:HYD1 signature containing ADP-ribosyltransferase family protein [Klebsiella aerogenes]|uniref:HYD1 signature containing ADP-ribosyltransferase family protein n=1 Tax=Klebsiella aerogenes TaxID=548 RepID=UPI002DD4289D|nr:HYD1 signature containing ADP-ribosyltransferase family protein [Klebsiella aerogenes]
MDPWGLAKAKCGGTDDAENVPTTRVRHYTNRKGSTEIGKTGKIVAQDNNRVYLEPANKKPLSQIEAEIKYQIKPGRGRDYVQTDVPNNQLEWVTNPRYHTEELTAKGDIILSDNARITKRK